ncbi:MAG: hypothetical protein NTNFB02_23180 [Nitrospira sp.]
MSISKVNIVANRECLGLHALGRFVDLRTRVDPHMIQRMLERLLEGHAMFWR